MGVIVDGEVSGKLPDRVAFAVNYPGYPSSMSTAIKTLGGEEGLAKARSSETNFLELRFRPDDPFAHPAFGELRHTSDLLLRLSRPARHHASKGHEKNSSLNSSSATLEHNESRQIRRADEEQKQVEGEIVARLEQTYIFEGMADYQYVMAVHASASNTHKRKGSHEAFVNEKGGLLDIQSGEMMMLVPPLFSVKDIPEDIFLRPPVGKKKRPLLLTEHGEPYEVLVPNFALDFKIKTVPKEGNWELGLVRGSEPWLRTAALVRLFQERPIWTKSMLNERLVEQNILVTDYYLRSLLFRIAYYFGFGPFRNLWIKNGYDPRVDPESRAYQMIDFRVPIPLRGQPEGSSPERKKLSFMDMCSFKAVPEKKFTQFQMIDLQDDDIQAQIEKPPERSRCSESTGWYRLSTIKRLRLILRLRFLALFPGEIARALESAEQKSLELFKLTDGIGEEEEEECPSDGRLDPLAVESGESHRMGVVHPACTISSHCSVQGPLDGVDLKGEEDDDDDDDDDDEEDEEEDIEEDELEEEEEEEEEDVEELEALERTMEGQEAPVLQGNVDPLDNIPKNYLQVLLGKFSFNSSGNEPSSGVDLNVRDEEGEYTIYEQDEDEDEDD